MKMKTLSDKITKLKETQLKIGGWSGKYAYWVIENVEKDVKKFIQDLKEEIDKADERIEFNIRNWKVNKIINQLAGDKLI